MAAGYYAPLIGRHSFFVTYGEQCWLFLTGAGDGNSAQQFRMQELECSHEEADMRMLLHAQHAAEAGHGAVIVRSPSTDVAIIACGLAGQIYSISLIDFADRHSPEDAVPGFVSHQSTSSQILWLP